MEFNNITNKLPKKKVHRVLVIVFAVVSAIITIFVSLTYIYDWIVKIYSITLTQFVYVLIILVLIIFYIAWLVVYKDEIANFREGIKLIGILPELVKDYNKRIEAKRGKRK